MNESLKDIRDALKEEIRPDPLKKFVEEIDQNIKALDGAIKQLQQRGIPTPPQSHLPLWLNAWQGKRFQPNIQNGDKKDKEDLSDGK